MYSKNIFLVFLILFSACFAKEVVREVPVKEIIVNKSSVSGTLTQLNSVLAFQTLSFKVYDKSLEVVTDENGNFSFTFNYNGPSELLISYVNSIGDIRTFRKYFSSREDLKLLINIDKNGTLKASSFN